MLKVIALIKRRADLARAEFRQHYEEIHAPLALRHLDRFSGYVRNHVTAELAAGPAGFDCLTEFWYADWDAVRATLAYMESPAAAPILQDELTFMDKAANVFFPVDELIALDGGRGAPPASPAKIVILAARPQGESPEAFAVRCDAALPALIETAPQPLRCVRHTVVRGMGPEPPWDVITMLWYATAGSAPRSPDGWPPGAGRRLIVSVSEHVTSLPPVPGA